jgi:ATP-dependent protease ClpP protease subunit
MKHKLVNQSNSNTAEILLYGIIGKYLDIDVDELVKEIEALRKAGVKNLVFYVNSDGGEVYQGNALWIYLNRSPFTITWVVDGIAASMMAMLLTNPKHYVIAHKYSKFMYHRMEGYARGTSNQVRGYADMMDKFEVDLIDMFASRTGLSADEANASYFTDNCVWLTAKEALDLHLVDEIRDGETLLPEPANLSGPREVYNHFSHHLTNLHKNQNENSMKKLASLFNLAADASEDIIAQQVQTLLDKSQTSARELQERDAEIATLKNQIAEQKTAKVKNLVDTAIAAKKFGEDMRETYTSMAEGNYAMAEKVINQLPGVDPIARQIEQAASQVPAAEKDWTYEDYFKKNRLENLKATNMPRFQELYKAKFGREFKA